MTECKLEKATASFNVNVKNIQEATVLGILLLKIWIFILNEKNSRFGFLTQARKVHELTAYLQMEVC